VETRKCPLIREEVYEIGVKNGIPVFFMPRRGFHKKYAEVAVNYGSIDKSFKVEGESKNWVLPDGVAHFLEHLLFERPNGNAFDDFYSLGVKINASTTFTGTSFYFTSTENFFEGLELLINMILNPYFTSENIEKERNIIVQEIRMLEDDPEWQLFFNLLSCMYQRHPVRNKIPGDIESVQAIDRSLLLKCHNSFYVPSNLVLFVSGDYEEEEVDNELKRILMGLKLTEKANVERIYPEEPAGVNKHEIKEKLPVEGQMFALGYKEVIDENRNLLERMLSTELMIDLLTGKSSALYAKMYDEGLIDLTYKAGYTGGTGFGYAVFSGRSKDYKKAVEYIQKEISARIEEPWKEEIFLRAKRKKWGQWVRNFNSLEGVGHSFTEMYLKGISIFEYMDILDSINYEDILKRLEEFLDPDFSSISVIIPKK
jgi:predicted Zn-dependent peptidase